MKLDTTAIETSEYIDNAYCATYKDNTVTVYTTDGVDHIATEYHRLGNSWIPSSYENNPTSTNTDICYSVEEVYNFNSPYDFIDPFLHTTAILSALLIFYFAIALIIKPFIRRV